MTINQNEIEFFKKLISFQSTFENIPAMDNCCDLFERELKGVLPVVTKHKFGPQEKPVLVLANCEGREFDLIFSGHIDVVPAGIEGLFDLTEDDENYYGRGTIDMKLPLAAVSFGVKEFLLNNKTELKIAIIITSDEEIDGMSVRYAAKDLGYKAKFAVIPDGGFENGIVVGQKGFFQFKVSPTGLTCHASRPSEGESALEKLLEIERDFRAQFPLPENPKHWTASLSMTAISSGDSSAVNQIPATADGYFDLRWTKSEDKQWVIEYLAAQNTPWETVAENGMLEVLPQETPFFKEFETAVAKIMPNPVEYVRTNGTSDAIFFVEGGTPTTLFLPNGGGAHANGEWVNKESLSRTKESIFEFLKNIHE